MAMIRDRPVSKPVKRAINYLHSIFQLGFHRVLHHSNWSSYGNSDITSGLTPGRMVCHRNHRASDYLRSSQKYNASSTETVGCAEEMQKKLSGRYWDRLVDMFDLHIHIDEIPTWFRYYTIG